MARAILEGVLVAELGDRIGAGVCGSLLAQLGAAVVVPEWAGEAKGKHRHRAQMLAGKRSLALNRDNIEDERLLDRLVARSDVVILSSDLDPSTPAGSWPGSDARVECDITAFGDSGPLRGAPLSEVQVQALSGILDTTGMPDGPPTPIRVPIVETMTGVYAAASCLSALRVRRQSGAGQAIDMALYDCAFAAMSTFLPRLLDGSGSSVGRVGNRHAMASPWNVFHALDGWLLVCAASDVQWRRICALVGRPELAEDPRYARVADRVGHHADVDRIVQDWVAGETIERCVELLGDAGIPCGPVAKVDGYPREANLDHRGAICRLQATDGSGDLFVPASPLRMSRTPGQSPDRIPSPDEDRAAVMRLLDREAASADKDSTTGRMPLAGVRILELGHYTTAPLSARHLANLGADVIKIEPLEGEAVRSWSPVKKNTGYFFTYTNADKRSVALDLGSQEDVEILRQLIERSDVLLENLKPGALAKRGFSADELARINPRLVYCAVSGFGADTIYPGRPAYDTVIQAMSGFMDLTRAGDVPVKTGISSADLMGAEMAVVAILAALEARDRTGLGQFIDLSMQDVGAWATMTLWNGDESSPHSVVLAASDGFVVVETREPGMDVAAAAGIAPGVARSMTRDELSGALSESGLRVAPVLLAREALDAEQTKARGLVFHVKDAEGEEWPLLASPLRLKGTPPVVRRPMGGLGSDKAAVLAEFGISTGTKDKLATAQ